jgi:hypothetical protein
MTNRFGWFWASFDNIAYNSTFIALIPKEGSPISFEEFRAISLCMSILQDYRKIDSPRMKPILSNAISDQSVCTLTSTHWASLGCPLVPMDIPSLFLYLAGLSSSINPLSFNK